MTVAFVGFQFATLIERRYSVRPRKIDILHVGTAG